MSKKEKNVIDIKKALNLFEHGYALKVKEINFYQFRIRDEEHSNIFYDWYHTTGKIVKNHNGNNLGTGQCIWDPEDVCLFIKKDIEKQVRY